ncbi:MAG: 2-C-methyl-D-erythritol 2,4-cyclodiphosphate synthase [Paludibacteraceae bacterium]|nr:2-C-methyl-D-erythritol 2,4-cyclodiphosphate synthase [Paludibacteraceae bacterium]
MRIGFGYDVHQYVSGRKLWLGGILITSDKGLLGHSDADVLIHALCDALLGAAALRDIGYHFPDTKGNEYENIDSKILLQKTIALVRQKGYELINADCTICAQEPKLSPYIEQMRECMASVLCTGKENISIKATTTEHLGFVGRKEGIAAYAAVLIEKQ